MIRLICALLSAFVLHSLAWAQTVQPLETVYFDPLGDTSPHRTATVFCDTSVPPSLPGGRPFRIVMLGGGFAPGSGLPVSSLNLTVEPFASWYAQGDVIVWTGYTVRDSSANCGTFHPDYWKGPRDALVIDETELTNRHAELDVVNLIQHLRHLGLATVPDLDRRPGRGGIYGRSAGSLLTWWVAGGIDRADPTAQGPRFRVSTRVAWSIHIQAISGFGAFADSWLQHHLKGTPGAGPWTLGSVPDAVVAAASFHKWGTMPKPPCHCTAGGPSVWPGPWDWFSFQGVLDVSSVHSSDHVSAIMQMPGHSTASIFHLTQGNYDAERLAFVSKIEARLQ